MSVPAPTEAESQVVTRLANAIEDAPPRLTGYTWAAAAEALALVRDAASLPEPEPEDEGASDRAEDQREGEPAISLNQARGRPG